MTSKLKVKFLRYKNCVLAEVLEQDESLRCGGILASKNGYSIAADENPGFSFDDKILCVRGNSRRYDNIVFYNCFDDEKTAIKTIRIFTELINEINAKGEEDKADEGFEVTIVG